MSATQVANQEKQVSLEYKFETEKKYGYEFETETTVDGKKLTSSGYASYQLTEKDVNERLDGKPLLKKEAGEATSTGFVITSDGYILTCAHCIEGAEKLTVQLGGKTYSAEIVDSDSSLDLAILKIEATDLPFVEFGDSEAVKLAQNVRVIGFPLSRVLGNSVKIAQGIVAGFIDVDGVSNLQIDGAVNPGNSGGPLVDDRGQVVGVVNAKLGGESISKVGFAIPIRYALEILDSHSIKYKLAEPELKAKPTTALAGPVLAAKLTPAVGFINSKIGEEGYSNFQNYSFSIGGTVAKIEDEQKYRETFQSDLILDSSGALVDVRDEMNLPMMFGSIARLPFEILPPTPKTKWKHVARLVVPLPTQLPNEEPDQQAEFDPFDPFGHFGPRGFGGPGFERHGPFGFGNRRRKPEPEIKKRLAPAMETIQYEITGHDGDTVNIKKTRALTTLDDDNEFSNLRINTVSQLKFNLRSGVFTRSEMTGQVDLKMGAQNLSFPMKLKYKQVDIDTILTADKPAAKRTPVSDQNIALTDEAIEQFIASDFRTFPTGKLHATLKALASWDGVLDRRDEVATVLVQVIESGQREFRKPALSALLRWQPTSATPHLIKELNASSAFSKRSWIKKLGRTADPVAAKVLAKLLTDSTQQWAAHLALIELGKRSEPEVLSVLQANVSNKEAAEICLKILKEVGTNASIEAIKQLVDKQQDWPLESKAKNAVDAIQSRLAK
jgi:hypothetical protein